MVEVFSTEDFDQWLNNSRTDRAGYGSLARIDRLAHGNPGDSKSVGRGVSELRLTYGPGYRIYCAQRDNRIVLLLCGGDQSTQSTDITKAHELAADWIAKEDDHDR